METMPKLKGTGEFDMDKVKTTLKQFARDWSKEVLPCLALRVTTCSQKKACKSLALIFTVVYALMITIVYIEVVSVYQNI